ncbi:hypothetical protein [Pseudomonas tohonis]|uniref:hypothetical protein n=1 Tax=Pseudomonas tohonis TaxID=2725477 RepID=UPI0022F10574|nr:hypothetical protein [Pseudomonas tohonis]
MSAFENFDTRYWLVKDKGWLAAREAQWLDIEKLLYVLNKNKKAKAIIKNYFFKGKLPDWEKLEDWSSSERHLDLMLFLYLHPSNDEAVLRPLRDMYVSSSVVSPDDVLFGIRSLCAGIGYIEACSGGTRMFYEAELKKELPHLLPLLNNAPKPYRDCKEIEVTTKGNNRLLFDLMWPDPTESTIQLSVSKFNLGDGSDDSSSRVETYPIMSVPFTLNDLWTMSKWLLLKPPLNEGASDMLYQYERPLEAWYHQCAKQGVPVEHKELELLLIAVFRICHFDCEAEGESPRSRFVQRMVATFKDREFSPSFKILLEHVRNGKVTVQAPWSYEPKVHASELIAELSGLA